MLRYFRKGGTAQFIVGAVVFAVIIVFILEFRAGRGPAASLGEQCALRVYDRCVDKKDFYAAYGLIVPDGLSAKKVRRLKLRQSIMDGLEERELLLVDAARLGISVSDSAIDDQLAAGRAHVSLPVEDAEQASYWLHLCLPEPKTQGCRPGSEMVKFLPVRNARTQRFDYKLYARFVRNMTNRSPREFKEMQRRELIAARMRDLIRSRVRVSEAEAFAEFKRERSTAVVRSVEVKRAWFAKYVVDSSDAAVEQWALSNKKQVDAAWKSVKKNWTKSCPMLRELVVSVAQDASKDDLAAARKKIAAAAARIKGGEPFTEVARQVSDGSMAALGGEIGCVGSGFSDSDTLLKAAAKLQPGQVSPVIQSDEGFLMVQLVRRVDGADLESAGRHFVARGLEMDFAADQAANQFATDLIAAVKSGQSLDDATTALVKKALAGAKHASSGAAGKSAGGQASAAPAPADDPDAPKQVISSPFNLTASPIADAGANVAAAAFGLNKPGDVVDKPLSTQSGLVVIQLKEKDLATRAEFNQHRTELMRSLLQAKRADALDRYMKQLKKAAEGKIQIDKSLLDEPKGSRDEG
jgi:peptidyl-prolyl cis-trans isomerase D